MRQRIFIVSSSPHIFATESIPGIMYHVVFALSPVVAASVYFFGIRALLLLIVCVSGAILSEHASQILRHKKTTIGDGSALITGMLLALVLPPAFPLWAAFLGAMVAIIAGKMIFGGLGYNVFNPALIGRAFLQAAFPVLITQWSQPEFSFAPTIPIVTQATPLAAFKFQGQLTGYWQLFWGHVGGSLGETSALAILIGGLYLVRKKYADWRIISGIFLSAGLFSGVLWLIRPEQYASPVFHFLSGGFLLGTFFMATDMVTSPITPAGRWIFGAGVGFFIILIRSFGGLPEGVMYAILLMNALTPLIDRFTKPRILGRKKKAWSN